MRNHPHFRAYLGLVAVCFLWGTTYLGIRMALESFPPFTLVCIRYLLSGALMLIGSVFMKVELPKGRELLRTSANGIVILGFGNGCLAVAEQWIPSGLAALFVTTSPFWMVATEAITPGGAGLHLPTILGMLVGLSGVVCLVGPGAWQQGFSGPIFAGFLVLQLGCAGWSIGSIAQRRQVTRAHPIVNGAVQQLATGVVCLIPALLVPSHPIIWKTRGVVAMLYLVFFGSIVGYSAYIYILGKLPVPIISIYNYINPVVAVFLGWLIYREAFGIREAIAMGVIFLGVALVKRYSG